MSATSDERERAAALARRVTVGIVTALPEERAAMLAMVVGPVPWSLPGQGAGLTYDLGEVPTHDGGRHVVAIALADVGNNIAAARGTLLLQHFPGVEAIIMVGIAGGVPNPERADDHVRLGDIVVSDRRGIIQYDFIKKTRTVTEVRASPRPPHARLLEAVRLLESDALTGSKPWEAHVKLAAKLEGAVRPGAAHDVLLESRTPFAPVQHPLDHKRSEGQPRVFLGAIASGNVLLKDPVWRDRLRDSHKAKAVEMEASGIADATWVHGVGYLVVRGICDYCDSNKNDDWHMYAAIVAAAYTRALLGRMASMQRGPHEPPINTPRTPNNLRVRNPHFQGREQELTDIVDVLSREKRMSIYGLSGVGKTALVLEFSHRAVDSGAYPGGVWWVAAEGSPVDALVAFTPLLRASASEKLQARLPEEEKRARVIAEQVRLALQGQAEASLLILDNVSEPWGEHLPGGLVHVLVTARNEGLVIGGVARRLDVLPKVQARALAERIAGRTRNKAEVTARERVLVTQLGGFAVAVEMAALAVKKWFRGSWATYERVLNNEAEQILEAPELYGDYGRGVFAAIDLSIDRCDAKQRLLLDAAAVLAPEAIPLDWVLVATQIEPEGVTEARARAGLRDFGLITIEERRRVISMHRLVHRRVRIRAGAENKARWDDLSRRVMITISEWLVVAARQFATRSEMEQVDAHRKHIEHALSAADRIFDHAEWAIIANRLATHLQNRAEYDTALTLLQQALARSECAVPPDPGLVAVSLSDLAGVYSVLGQPEQARPLLERALSIDEKFLDSDQHQIAQRLSNLATVYNHLGRNEDALPLAARALALDEAACGVGHPEVAMRLIALAYIHMSLDKHSAARPLLERALAIDEAVYGSDHPKVAIDLTALVTVYQNQDQVELARSLAARALAIDEAHYGSSHPNVALRLFCLSCVLVDLGQRDAARPLVERAVTIGESSLPPEHPDLVLYRKLLAGLTIS